MTPITHDLLWLLLDDDTGRLVIDRRTTGHALAVAASAENLWRATQPHPRTASPRRLREKTLLALHATHRVLPRRTRFGGVISRTTWPTTDLLGKQELRRPLQRALFDTQPADDATRALIAILHGVDALAIQCPRWSHRETNYWARRFIAQHADCTHLAESLAHVEREALADALSFGTRPLFANPPFGSATGISAQRPSAPTPE
ncbi:GPP34 family phosphoprotein [Nocardia nova]|uniref:GPP34 family phosphoprotein n=1 Tax=Nocardia nova TaxID=37330 RepID=UPI0007A38213|nr:GPP34 family phosphoprotein [Nocardia nova]